MKKPFRKAASGSDHYELDQPATSEEIIGMARALLERRFRRGYIIESPNSAADYLTMQLALRDREIFCALFLDTRHRVLAFEVLFQGTIDSSVVHPREVVKRALLLNAAAVILAHNHPSGVCEPSQADQAITRRIVDALALVDVRVLDHMVVGANEARSMAQMGLL